MPKTYTWDNVADWYYKYGFFQAYENMEEIIREWRNPTKLMVTQLLPYEQNRKG